MAAGIASGFVRKLYRILDQESAAIISWDPSGTSFSIYDSAKLNEVVLPRYFRGRLCAFRQQLVDHGFELVECEDDDTREAYRHPDFRRGCPDRLSEIVRNPKPKRKSPAAARKMQATGNGGGVGAGKAARRTGVIGVNSVGAAMGELQLHRENTPGSLSVHILPSSGAKRSSPTNLHATDKRVCLDTMMAPSEVPAAGFALPMAQNPLFSNDPAHDVDVARVFSLGRMSETGLLPPSTDLPEPISYLNQGGQSVSFQHAVASSASASSSSSPAPLPLANVDDMLKSALHYLVSTSTTAVDAVPEKGGSTFVSELRGEDATITFRGEQVSTSEFLSSLLASSVTATAACGGGDAASGAASGLSDWAAASNPLFSDKSSEGEEEEDSIWNLLVASSVDRVKTAMSQLATPQQRMKRIVEERERLEEQRRKIFAGADEDANSSRGASQTAPPPAPRSLKRRAAGMPPTQQRHRKAQAVAPVAPASAEDGLWRLLMSSSVDWLRKSAHEFDV